MFDKFKYIIFDGPGGGDGIIFAPSIQHKEIANKINYPVLSAGFIHINICDGKIKIKCFGKSNSLKIGCLAGDEYFFRKLLE